MELQEMFNYLVEMDIASEDAIDLITTVNGYSEETVDDIIYARCGYQDFEQYLEAEDKDTYNEYYGDDEEEDDEDDE